MNNHKFTILIPNGTGPTNIGDQVILQNLLVLLKANFRNPHIILHSSEPKLYKEKNVNEIEETLYSWAVYQKPTTLTRIVRMSCLIINFGAIHLNKRLNIGPIKLRKLISDYFKADLIIFVGGGSLRSKKGLTQTLNLIMISLFYAVAKKSSAKKIVSPISFGPFAYKWQKKLFINLLKNFELVSLREIFSFQELKKHKLKNIIQSTDLALLTTKKNKIKMTKNDKFILGYTIRNWFDKNEQEKLESAYVDAISAFINEYPTIQVQPIVQVDAPKYGDFDMQITQKIRDNLKENNLNVLKIEKVNDVEDSKRIYSNINLLLGMRMHSNIIAATQGTPFVAVSYEYKTEGISKELGMGDYCIKADHVNDKNLYNLLVKVYKNKEQTRKILELSVKKIQKKESNRWNEIFQSYVNL